MKAMAFLREYGGLDCTTGALSLPKLMHARSIHVGTSKIHGFLALISVIDE
jgi:hypothetical protein